ncbi:lytic murein transglycosylase [Mailhella sp.]|uniref:lytic murein transglycosylase n=1 Tax=Mailhella sp. TaxID=1981029 RepID=UPI004064BE87
MFRLRSLILCTALVIPLAACSGKDASQAQNGLNSALHTGYGSVENGTAWRDIWDSLSNRLQRDGLDAARTQELFARLNTPRTLVPMGAKIKELYSAQFLPSKTSKPVKTAKPRQKSQLERTLGVPGPWYKDVVTRASAAACLDFIRTNCAAFRQAQRIYGVPPEIGAALLFVETRLGRVLGRENAFYSLASMAVTRSPETIADYLDDLPGISTRKAWVRSRMETKADWAYDELKALLEYCFANGIDPYSVPGSIYGAIGMCQFMPSNLPRFAADGDSDGIINIFEAPDAIASLSRYLKENGWKRGMTQREQAKVLLRYNKSTTYANTILALARYITFLEHPALARKAANASALSSKTKRGPTVKASAAKVKRNARKSTAKTRKL